MWRFASVGAVVGALTLTACVGDAGSEVSPTPAPTPEVTVTQPTPDASAVPDVVDSVEVVSTEDIATDLEAPWGLAFHQDGTFYVTERDSARVLAVNDGEVAALTGPGADALAAAVDNTGEGGLLGITLSPDDQQAVYVYLTRADDNAVLRMALDGDSLSEPTEVVTGIPKAGNHNGGAIRFGPDGHLYIATGDAAEPALAQDPDSLAGKILRVQADGENDGEPVADNPDGTAVYSWGHRNVQGIGWSEDGRMFASEFGASEADELNVIEPGLNYGWPEMEGMVGAPDGTELGETVDGYTFPVAEWQPTSIASPSGIAVTDEGVYVAMLRGSSLHRVSLLPEGVGEPQPMLEDWGRLRNVHVGPDGALYVLTNNTDGRGDPGDGDDRLVRVEVVPAN